MNNSIFFYIYRIILYFDINPIQGFGERRSAYKRAGRGMVALQLQPVACIGKVRQQLIMDGCQGGKQGRIPAHQQGCAGTPCPHQGMQCPCRVQHVQQTICSCPSTITLLIGHCNSTILVGQNRKTCIWIFIAKQHLWTCKNGHQ